MSDEKKREEREAEAAAPEAEPTEATEAAEPDAPRPRRRSAETTAGSSEKKRAARRPRAEGPIVVRAKAKYVRCAPRKARLVIGHIRGKPVDEARAILTHTPRGASRDVLKLLDSCVANAEANHEVMADELRVHEVYVDEGPTLKRFRPRALGRATRIRKRTSHMTIALISKD